MKKNTFNIFLLLIFSFGSFYLGQNLSNKKEIVFPIYIKDKSANKGAEIIYTETYDFNSFLHNSETIEVSNAADCIEAYFKLFSPDNNLISNILNEKYIEWVDNNDILQNYCIYVIAILNAIDTENTSNLSSFYSNNDSRIFKYTNILLENFKDQMKNDDWFLGLVYYNHGLKSNSDQIYYENLIKSATLDFEPAIGSLARWHFFSGNVSNRFSQDTINFSIRKLEECIKNTPISELDTYSSEGLTGAYECHWVYASLLIEGYNYDKNLIEAISIFEQLADRGHPEANFQLSRIYCSYMPSSDLNFSRSKIFLERAVDEIGLFNFYAEKYERIKKGYCGYARNIVLARDFLDEISAYFPNYDEAKWFISYELLSSYLISDFDEVISTLKDLSAYNYESSITLADFYLGYFFDEGYIGIGIEYRTHMDGLLITNIFNDSPAQKSGLKVNDIIFRIDEQNFKSFKNDNNGSLLFESLLSGQKNDAKRISIIREGVNRVKNYTINLDNIDLSGLNEKYYNPELAEEILLKAKYQDHSFGVFMPGYAEATLGNISLYHKENKGKNIDTAINYLDQACKFDIINACSELIFVYLDNEEYRNINEAASLVANKFIIKNNLNKALEAIGWAAENELLGFGDLVDEYVENIDSEIVLRMVAGIAVSASDYHSGKISDIPQANNDVQEMIRIFDEFGVANLNTIGNFYDVTSEELKIVSGIWSDFSEEESKLVSIIEGNGLDITKTDYLAIDLIFYYSGHGISYDGVNYLVPVDFPENISSFEEARPYLISFNKIVKSWTEMNPNGQNIFILDACRTISTTSSSNDDFFLSSKDGVLFLNDSKLGPLAPTQTGSNAMIIYSTSPGKPAYYKQEGENSIFTKSLVRAFDQTPANSLQDIMLTVQEEVKNETNSNQIPWVETSLTKKFYLSQ